MYGWCRLVSPQANNLFPIHSEPMSLREVRAALPDTVADIHRGQSPYTSTHPIPPSPYTSTHPTPPLTLYPPSPYTSTHPTPPLTLYPPSPYTSTHPIPPLTLYPLTLHLHSPYTLITRTLYVPHTLCCCCLSLQLLSLGLLCHSGLQLCR